MKKYFCLPLLLLPLSIVTAQEGMDFFTGSWEDVLTEARSKNKIIFLDAFATWCGPCKMMDRDVFTEKAVGDFFNEHFLNIQIDMEKGEGLALAQKYRVEAYPSLLFLDGQGQVVHRAIGYHSVPKFLELGHIALDPDRRFSSFRQRYEDGERDPAFLYNYAMASYEAMDDRQGEIAREYLATQSDWKSEENMLFILTFVEKTDSKMFEFLADNREAFEAQFGTQAVIDRIQNLIIQEAFAETSGPDALKKVDVLFERVYPEVAPQLSALFRLNYYQATRDIDQFARAAIDYFNQYPSDDAMELNNMAWTFYELVDDKKMLKEALKWAQRSVTLNDQSFNNDTMAALYYKIGKKKKAIQAAEKAIRLAEASGEDSSSTQELLEMIRNK